MWMESEQTLTRSFSFNNFVEALAFVNKVGEIAEELGHHPDICIKDYNSVHISTTTHDVGSRVTEKDQELARRIDALAL